MKRCPHCRAEDHEDAILCKNCHRSFSEPVAPRPAAAARSQARPRKKKSGSFGGLRLLLLLGALARFGVVFGGRGEDLGHGAILDRQGT